MEEKVIQELDNASVKSSKKLEEERLAKKRFYYLLVGVALILGALIIWEIVDLFI